MIDQRPALTTRTILLTALPAVLAVGVFGVLYGAAARPLIGEAWTIAASLFVFSGALQFAIVGLVAAGAAGPAILLTALILNLRHLMLGAVLRPWLGPSRLKRAAQAFFLLDESFGFAVAAGTRPGLSPAQRTSATERTLVITGLGCYVAWIVGTVVGVFGPRLPALEGFAGAVFPVLFIGLAALAARSRSIVARAIGAAVVTALIAVLLPDVRALAPVVAGVLVALPGRADPPT